MALLPSVFLRRLFLSLVLVGVSLVSAIGFVRAEVNWPDAPDQSSQGGGLGSVITPDAQNNRLGIGTDTPEATLDVAGDVRANSVRQQSGQVVLQPPVCAGSSVVLQWDGQNWICQDLTSYNWHEWGFGWSASTPEYSEWNTEELGACSQYCDGGTQTQKITCRRSDGEDVDDKFCFNLQKPISSRLCNRGVCPSCGASNGVRSPTPPDTGLCGIGVATEITANISWDWVCSNADTDERANVSCSAGRYCTMDVTSYDCHLGP